jgi:RHS repeat-associated protein
MQHRQTEYSYDALQRPNNTSLRLSALAVSLVEKIVYGTTTANNQKGQIAQQYDQSGKTNFTAYDFKGNLLSLAKQLCRNYKQTIDWNRTPAMEQETFVQSFTYDAMNRPTKITKPDNTVEQYSYNKAGLLESVQARIRGAATWTPFVSDINYNEKGQRTDIYFGNDSKTKYEYDENTFRLTRLLTTRYKGQDILQDLNYQYDPVGNITKVEDDAQQTFYFDNAVIAPTGTYTYDALYRLTEATGRELKGLAMPANTDFANNIALPNPAANAMQNYTQQYTYDALGNILQTKSKSYWTRDYYYDNNTNRLLNHDGRTDVYHYDAHGNTTAMPHLSSMQYDYADRLKQTDLGGGGDVWYVYDASGERVRKIIEKTGGIKEERIYLGGYEVYTKTTNGVENTRRETLHISDGSKRIAIIDTVPGSSGGIVETQDSVTIRYQYDNHLGSACLELDKNAAIISYEEYHPFGTTSYRSGRTETEVSLKRYKYVGKERDEETGLYFYGARYYAGWLGRFVSVDPKAGERQWLNPYNYVQNNPINKIDPDGKLDDGYQDLEGNYKWFDDETADVIGREDKLWLKVTDDKKIFNMAAAGILDNVPELTDPGQITKSDNLTSLEMWLDSPSENLGEGLGKIAANIGYSIINSPVILLTGETLGGTKVTPQEKMEAFIDVAPGLLSFGLNKTAEVIQVTKKGLQGYNKFVKEGKKIGVTASEGLPKGMKWQQRAGQLYQTNKVNQKMLNNFDEVRNVLNLGKTTKKEIEK